jgi:5-formyltetrahydrofolate cyclo-ligase
MEMPIEDLTAWRRALRREMIARREMLSATDHAALSDRIIAHAVRVIAPPAVAAFCWPIKQEPDVRPLIARWQAAGCIAALPVVVSENAPLAFRVWTAETPLVPDRYGIPAPTVGAWVRPEVILLPLNGFDAAGYRLGYGGGYFDRTLASLQPRPTAVGVGFEMNRLDSIRPEAHDQQLDWIITEAGAFRPDGAKP